MNRRIGFLLGIAPLTADFSSADLLKLKQGPGMQGILLSADSQQIILKNANGSEQIYPVDAVARVELAPLPPPPAPARAALIPAGTSSQSRHDGNAVDGRTTTGGSLYGVTIDDPARVVVALTATAAAQLFALKQ